MMRRKVIMLLIVGALCFAVYRNVTFFMNRNASSSIEAGLASDRGASSEQAELGRTRRGLSPVDRIKFASGMGSDPFGLELRSDAQGRTGGTTTSAGLLQLNAVLKSPQRKLALINGRIYSEGDLVAGRTITRIDHNRVLLAGGGDGLVIELEPSHFDGGQETP